MSDPEVISLDGHRAQSDTTLLFDKCASTSAEQMEVGMKRNRTYDLQAVVLRIGSPQPDLL
jgi:hypothetical protein